MRICSNCGTQVVEGAKFCQKCGTPVSSAKSNNQERQQEYAGKVYKCPNCGEILKSFEANCPSCGLELRGTKATNAVREFALKLEAIEAKREYEKPKGLFSQTSIYTQISKTDEQKINLIKNFSVPNTKEDILEFMILATSNVDADMYGSIDTPTAGAKALNEAWNSKIKQVYAKAQNTYGTDSDFERIQKLYDSCFAEIKTQKKKNRLKTILLIGWVPLLWIILIPTMIIGNNKDNKNEEIRLEAIVKEIESSMENGNYKNALMNAELMDYNGHKDDRERYWEVRQKYYIDEIISEAEKQGIILNYTPAVEDEKERENSDSNSGFAKGFKEGVQPGLDSAKESVDEFKKTMNGIAEDNKEVEEDDKKTEDIFPMSTIKKDTMYSYGKDEYSLYVATAVTDEIIKIEKWGKTMSSSKEVSYDYDVGTYKINDSENEFQWLNKEQLAFSLKLTDEKDSIFKKSKTVVFTISNSDSDTNKGSYIKKNVPSYSYGYDDWNQYKATLLNDDIIKIECWYRPMSMGGYHYSYDVCLIDCRDENSDFNWTDDKKTSFTVTLIDSENRGLKKGRFVTFDQE